MLNDCYMSWKNVLKELNLYIGSMTNIHDMIFFNFINGNHLIFGFQLAKKWKMETNCWAVPDGFNPILKLESHNI